LIFGVFVLAGMVNPSPTRGRCSSSRLCVVLVEVAEIFVYFNDKRRARLHPTRTLGWPTTSCRRSTTSSG